MEVAVAAIGYGRMREPTSASFSAQFPLVMANQTHWQYSSRRVSFNSQGAAGCRRRSSLSHAAILRCNVTSHLHGSLLPSQRHSDSVGLLPWLPAILWEAHRISAAVLDAHDRCLTLCTTRAITRSCFYQRYERWRRAAERSTWIREAKVDQKPYHPCENTVETFLHAIVGCCWHLRRSARCTPKCRARKNQSFHR